MKDFNTFNPKKILCPVDFSELSDLALRYAAVGAREFDARLTILHAETFELPRYFSRSQTDRFMQELTTAKKGVESDLIKHVKGILTGIGDSLDLEYAVVDRQPAEAILDTAEKIDTDLIILGTHGYGGIKRFLLGSVAQRTVENAKAPVFLVRQKESEFIDTDRPDAIPRLEKILCPCNLSHAAKNTLNYAISLSHRFHSRLTVLYSQEDTENISLNTTREKLDEWIKEANNEDVPIEMIIRKGHAAEQIIQHARENNEDLIVLTARFHPIGQSTFFGKTTDLVIRHATVPVLVTPYFDE